MNGVHDMGGMHGFGPIDPEPNEPLFHHPWEARALALTLAMGAWRKWNIDASRFQRELIPPATYLRMTYYEKWIAGLVELMVSKGLLTRAEANSGKPAAGAAKADPPLKAAAVPGLLSRGSPTTRDVPVVQRFQVGNRIVTKNMHPTGHTRLPRYVRGKPGVIQHDHGVHVFPDSNALFKGEAPQRLYSVRFEGRDLWGEASKREAVYVDLWESYLDLA
ncbi:MAG TPA: nitrile hydratase subunit beta [bacterium]